jgi:tRNA pseudouridine38-40 synthase
MPRRRYAIRLTYEGAAFRGWQRQPGLPTVQEALEGALRECGDARVHSVAARTDAGVHALGQVVCVTVDGEPDPAGFRAALNRALPPSILCLDVALAGPSFHARAGALQRRYVYLVGTPAPPGLERYAWSLPDARAFPGLASRPLDVDAMRAALALALGRHDFSPFARPGAQRETVRELTRADVVPARAEAVVAVILEANGFLRAMVRNLVGTAVTVGLGLAPPSRITELLEQRGRYRGVRAPAWGLTLAAVRYPPPSRQGPPP